MLNTKFTVLPCTSPIITQNLECNSYGCHSQTISLIFLHALSLVFISVSLSRACLCLPRPSPCLGRVCTSPAPPLAARKLSLPGRESVAHLAASPPGRGSRPWPCPPCQLPDQNQYTRRLPKFQVQRSPYVGFVCGGGRGRPPAPRPADPPSWGN